MNRLRLVVMAAIVFGLTLGLAGMASAAAISCGDCHGAPPVNGDNCSNTGRGLHGIHYNYSSASYAKTVANYGKCAYCHTATTSTAPTLTHNNGLINITGGASGGRAVGLSFNAANGTCANTCHKNTAAAAPWGNYTSPSIKLACNSCHNDSSGGSLSGAHAAHMGSGATVPGGTAMNAANNAGCVTCHPNNTGEGKLARGTLDNGSVKAYPHASDGTNVVSDNVTLSGQITSATKSGTSTTCATACHPRSNALGTPVTWGGTLDCNMCHYYAASPTRAGNAAVSAGSLPGSHSLHFDGGLVCTDCHHDNTGDVTHATNLPVSSTGVTFKTGLTYSGGASGNCTSTPTGCHLTTVTWGADSAVNGCAACHEYPDGNNWTGNNGHVVQYATSAAVNTHLRNAASYNKVADTYDGAVGSNDKCGLCHGGGTHRNASGTVNMRAATGYGKCAGEFTITVTNSGSNVTCGNVKCHNGKATPNWW